MLLSTRLLVDFICYALPFLIETLNCASPVVSYIGQSKAIRGFCHLYDGQEACATGANAAMTLDDSWITSYRCHYIALIRGGTVEVCTCGMFLLFTFMSLVTIRTLARLRQ